MTENRARPLMAFMLTLCLAHAVAGAGNSSNVVSGPAGQKIDQYVTRLESLGFSGAVLVAENGKIILEKGYGLADREKGTSYTPETVFDIGSITKQFTAAAILRLEMMDKLRVTDSISRYLDGVPEDKQAITLHHLLTHSSGLEGGFGDDYEETPRDVLVEKALGSKLRWVPGTQYGYSNAGYSLLGSIVEKVSGQPYETFLHEQLFRPAGMEKTGYRIPQWKREALARGYRGDNPWGTPLDQAWAPDGPWWHLRANGGLLSTVGDLYKWHRALEGDSILSTQAKSKYFAPHVSENDSGSSHYGYGWKISTTPRNTKLISHTGGNGIFAADMRRFVDEGSVVIAGSAQSDFQSTWITNAITGMLFGHQIIMPPAVAHLDPAVLSHYAGTYALRSGGKLVVTTAPAGANHEPHLEVTPQGRDAFEALMGGVSREVHVRLADQELRLLTALEQVREEKYGPLADVYGAPEDEVRPRTMARLTELQSRLGPLRRFEILGTVVRDERVSTWVRFKFENGVQVFEHVWEGAKIVWVRPIERLDRKFFVPESSKEIFSYDPGTQQVQRIGIEFGKNGRIKTLILRVASGEVRAGRS